ncbi:MAG TPA: M4 family metallopeptidase [Saprospiraceae bacterium]|nr:M4 family metallopeptidase [Saprospiraceae bacterium]
MKTQHVLFALIFFLFCGFGSPIHSQSFVPTALREDNQVIRNMAREVNPAGWIYLKQSARIGEFELFSTYKEAFGLADNDVLMLKRSQTDEYGYTHNRYQQYYKDVRVEGAEYDEHILECIVLWVHGKLLEQPGGRDVTPALSESAALLVAMNYMNADTFSWQDPSWEADFRYTMEDSNATSYPTGELVLANVNLEKVIPENYYLAWKFIILAIAPETVNLEIYINAENGAIISARDPSQDNGPADLLFNYGEQNIDTRFHWGPFPWNNYFHLRTDNEGRNVYTKRGTAQTERFRFPKAKEVWELSDDWPVDDAQYTTVHWGISQAWDYFDQVHNRQGWNDDANQIHVWSGSNIPNARYGRTNGGYEFMEFGELDQQDLQIITMNPGLIFNGIIEIASVDIAGHEFAHGVTRHASGLAGINEPGALNESFSDIFGLMVERFTFPGNWDWIAGEDAFAGTPADIAQRSLIDPGAIPSIPLPDRPSIGLPNVFMGPRWYFGLFDGGGVHVNCGPQNRWFNLLSTGGVENGIIVQGIGIENTARIVYFSLTTQIQNMSIYPDARAGAIAAARVLFGDCSFETIQTTNAWSAVGVGNIFGGNCLEISGPFVVSVRRTTSHPLCEETGNFS